MQTLEQQTWHELECAANSAGGIEVAMVRLPIEKVKALVAGRTRPAAPAEGLEIAAWQRKHPTAGWLDCREEDIPHYKKHGQEVRELSPRSQATAIIAAKNSEITALENLRPHWAKGYSSDSVAAQTVTAALSQLWGILGAANQTEAVQYATALQAKLEASEKARDDAITQRLKDNHDWRVAHEALEAKSKREKDAALYCIGEIEGCAEEYFAMPCRSLKERFTQAVNYARAQFLEGRETVKTFVAYRLEWIAGARPPVHPNPMDGAQSFHSFDNAIAFMKRQAADAQFVSLTERTMIQAETDRSPEARAALSDENE